MLTTEFEFDILLYVGHIIKYSVIKGNIDNKHRVMLFRWESLFMDIIPKIFF